MTSPLLAIVYPPEKFIMSSMEEVISPEKKPFTVLVSVALPRSGQGLMTVASAIAGAGQNSRVYALHLIRASDRPSFFVKGKGFVEEDALGPLIEQAKKVGTEVRPLSFISSDPAEDIVDVSVAKGADLILLGWHKPLIGQAVLGGTVRTIMNEAKINVAVFIDRGMKQIKKVLVPYLSSTHDRAALSLAHRLAMSMKADVTILHIVNPRREPEEKRLGVKEDVEQVFQEAETQTKVHLKVIENASPVQAVLEESKKDYDLVMIGVSEELELDKGLFGLRPEKIAAKCPTSLLIVKQS